MASIEEAIFTRVEALVNADSSSGGLTASDKDEAQAIQEILPFDHPDREKTYSSIRVNVPRERAVHAYDARVYEVDVECWIFTQRDNAYTRQRAISEQLISVLHEAAAATVLTDWEVSDFRHTGGYKSEADTSRTRRVELFKVYAATGANGNILLPKDATATVEGKTYHFFRWELNVQANPVAPVFPRGHGFGKSRVGRNQLRGRVWGFVDSSAATPTLPSDTEVDLTLNFGSSKGYDGPAKLFNLQIHADGRTAEPVVFSYEFIGSDDEVEGDWTVT